MSDFDISEDVVDLTGFKAINNENDLKNNHVKFVGGDLVIFAGGSETRFDGVSKAEFKDMQFEF